jgi:hypothetical protein
LHVHPLLPKRSCWCAEYPEHVQREPDRCHEPLFKRSNQDAIGDPVGGISGRLALWDEFKLLRDRPRFAKEFADLLEEEDGAFGGLGQEFYLCFPPCAFMTAGSGAEWEGVKSRKRTPALALGRL